MTKFMIETAQPFPEHFEHSGMPHGSKALPPHVHDCLVHHDEVAGKLQQNLNEFLEICTIFDSFSFYLFCYSYMNNFQTTLTVSPSMSVVSNMFLSFSGLPAACIKVFTMSTYPTIIKHKMIMNRF